MFFLSSKRGRNELFLYLALKFPWCLEPRPKTTQNCLRSGSPCSSVQLPKTTQSGSRGHGFVSCQNICQTESGTSKLCEHPPCKPRGHWLEHLTWPELPAEPPSWLQPSQGGFRAHISSKDRVILKDVH